MKDDPNIAVCPRDDIGAYIDDELSAEVAWALEKHMGSCSICSRVLREQRQILTALSISLEGRDEIELPADFTKKVVSNAESSVAGLRRPNEILTAVSITAALLLFVLFAFGGETMAVASTLAVIGEKLAAVGGFVLRTAGNAAFAAAVIGRSLASHNDVVAVLAPFSLAFAAAALFFSSRWVLRRRNA